MQRLGLCLTLVLLLTTSAHAFDPLGIGHGIRHAAGSVVSAPGRLLGNAVGAALSPAQIASQFSSLGIGGSLASKIIANPRLVTQLGSGLAAGHPFMAGFQALSITQRQGFLRKAMRNGRIRSAISGNPAEAFRLAGLPFQPIGGIEIQGAGGKTEFRSRSLDRGMVESMLDRLELPRREADRVMDSPDLVAQLQAAFAVGNPFREYLRAMPLAQRRRFFQRALARPAVVSLINQDPKKALQRAGVAIPKMSVAHSHVDMTLEGLGVPARLRNRVKSHPKLLEALGTGLAPGHAFNRRFAALNPRLQERFIEKALKDRNVVASLAGDPESAFRRSGIRLPQRLSQLPSTAEQTLGRLGIEGKLARQLKRRGDVMGPLAQGLAPGHPFQVQYLSLSRRQQSLFLQKAMGDRRVRELITRDPVAAFKKAGIR